MTKRTKTAVAAAAAAVLASTLIFQLYRIVGKGSSGQTQIILIVKALDETDFWTTLAEGAETAAVEYDVQLTVMGPEYETEIDLQNEMILEAVEAQPDAVVLAPCSTVDTLPYARQITEAGIELVLADSTLEDDIAASVVATDNYELGYKLGVYMSQFVDEDTVIGIVAHTPWTSTTLEREEGFKAGLGGAASQVVETVYCNSDTELAYELTVQMIEDYPGIDMIVGLNEYSSVGAAAAVRELGLSDSICMAGIDSSIEQIKFLEEGVFETIGIQKPYNMGYLAVEAAVLAVQGQEVESVIDSGSEIVTRENMYTEENQKLLFPVGE